MKLVWKIGDMRVFARQTLTYSIKNEETSFIERMKTENIHLRICSWFLTPPIRRQGHIFSFITLVPIHTFYNTLKYVIGCSNFFFCDANIVNVFFA